MSLIETLRVAMEGILLNKVRSILTVLGIIIGTATIILVMAVGQGSQQAVNQQYSQLSVTTIYVMASDPSQADTGLSKLNIADAKVIENCPSVSQIAPQISGKAEVSSGSLKQSVTVIGVSEEYHNLTNLEFTEGSFFTKENEEQKEKVAVIGAETAETLFGKEQANYIGQYININRQKYKVTGIIKRKGDSIGGTNIDESVVIPLTTAERHLFGTSVKPRMVVQAKDIDSVKTAIAEITEALREAHKLRANMDDDFRVRDAGSRLVSAQKTSKTMSVLLIVVATIVLIVGGIGIMNVMFVTVRERTKEIGIRRAIGARKKDVLRQFLFEAIGLSLIGGLIGVATGEVIIPLMEYFDVETIRTVLGVAIALVFSIVVGVFFGYYPAQKAADFSPIDALRYE